MMEEETQESLSEVEEIRRRLHEAVTSYRETKQIHDMLFEDGQIIEEQIKAVEAENNIFTNTLKKLQQQMAEQETVMRNMEENQLLKVKHEHVTAELFCLSEKYQEIRSAVQEFQDRLEEVQEVLHSNDEQIHKLSRTVSQKNEEREENLKIIEDLKTEQRELRKQLDARQEDEILVALQFQEESNTLTEPRTTEEKDRNHPDERPHQTEQTKRSWWCDYAKVLWKGVKLGSIILGLLLLVASVYGIPDPDCSPSDLTC